jgi:DNA-binding NarL/FixJ family response regulator
MRVVIAEDAVVMREGLARLLEDRGHEIVAAVADGDDLLEAATRHHPDVAVVDIRMPPSYTDEGLRAAIALRREQQNVGVLVFSQYVETRYATQLLAEGSAGVGYLLKDRVADVGEFVDAPARVAAGGTALDPEVVSQLLGASRRGAARCQSACCGRPTTRAVTGPLGAPGARAAPRVPSTQGPDAGHLSVRRNEAFWRHRLVGLERLREFVVVEPHRDELVEQLLVVIAQLRDLSRERADGLARLRVLVLGTVLQLNRHQAWEIALRIRLEVGIGPRNATGCLLAEEHLDCATSMDLTPGKDHLHGFHSPPRLGIQRDLPCGYRSEGHGRISSSTKKDDAPREPVFLVVRNPKDQGTGGRGPRRQDGGPDRQGTGSVGRRATTHHPVPARSAA